MSAVRRVLLVENDPHVLAFEREVLEDAGYAVVAARNGKAALDRLDAMRPGGPDAIVLDLDMPEMDGRSFAAAYRLTATPPPHAPLIVVSAAVDAHAACQDIGGAACLRKPLKNVEALVAAVGMHALPERPR